LVALFGITPQSLSPAEEKGAREAARHIPDSDTEAVAPDSPNILQSAWSFAEPCASRNLGMTARLPFTGSYKGLNINSDCSSYAIRYWYAVSADDAAAAEGATRALKEAGANNFD
jgi:hypothetical protein